MKKTTIAIILLAAGLMAHTIYAADFRSTEIITIDFGSGHQVDAVGDTFPSETACRKDLVNYLAGVRKDIAFEEDLRDTKIVHGVWGKCVPANKVNKFYRAPRVVE